MKTWGHIPLVRLVVAFGVGLVVGILVGTATPLGVAAAILSGWCAGAIVFSAWALVSVWPMDADETRDHALAEAPGRRVAGVLSLAGSVLSLVAVVATLMASHDVNRVETYLMAGIAVVSAVSSWVLIQVNYMLRYARIYYAEPEGGISFNTDESPQYSDFAYFSVGLGMTYQVADTDVSTKEIRKLVLAQTMMAYLFGAVIFGTVINLITSLS